ncbi:type III secretion system inner rod subunit SctI [Salmonella enterica]|nr:type III secretion system inner rod subunit SctI [Salmonella enterica]
MVYVTQQINNLTKYRQENRELPLVNLNERVNGMSDESVVNAFANYAVQTERWKNEAFQSLDGPQALSPDKLIALQRHVLNYNIEVSLMATLARKTVGTVETVLRA